MYKTYHDCEAQWAPRRALSEECPRECLVPSCADRVCTAWPHSACAVDPPGTARVSRPPLASTPTCPCPLASTPGSRQTSLGMEESASPIVIHIITLCQAFCTLVLELLPNFMFTRRLSSHSLLIIRVADLT